MRSSRPSPLAPPEPKQSSQSLGASEPQSCRPSAPAPAAPPPRPGPGFCSDPLFLTKISRDLESLGTPSQPTTAEFSRLDAVAVQDSLIDDQHPSTLHTPVDDPTDAKMKFLKVGRVAIITRGRYAGKKVRISKTPGLSGADNDAERRGLGNPVGT